MAVQFLLTLALGVCLGAAAQADTVGSIGRTSFFAGGVYTGPQRARVMRGQVYVEQLTPERVTRSFQLVLIHGQGQTAVNWLNTPDGRQGWGEWFAQQGWIVHLIDQPARGRSAWQPGLDGPMSSIPVATVERRFTAPAPFNEWPQARLHTRWPGGPGAGRAGDPVFDQFIASQMASIGNRESEVLMRAAGAALLDRIQGARFGIEGMENVTPDRWLAEGETVSIAGQDFAVLHCPGHTPGHVAFVSTALGIAVVGDAIFQGSVGRTDFPYGDPEALIAAIRDKLLPLGDDIRFLCGHGPGSTFGEERRSNPFLNGRG